MDFLMSAKLTQDCPGIVVSTLRLKTSKPSAIEFRNSRKIVIVAQLQAKLCLWAAFKIILYTTQWCYTTSEVFTTALYCKHWTYLPRRAE